MNVLVFIQRRSLLFYYANQAQPLECLIPETVMNDLEILNEQELHTLVQKYIPPKDPKARTQVIMLLSDDICFSSWLEKGKEEEVKKTLMDTAPFVHIESVTIPFDQHMLYITTNQDLYNTLGRVLETYNCDIIGVYPWVITSYSKAIKEGEAFSSVVVARLFEAQSHIKEYGFSYLNTQTPASPVVEEKAVPQKKPISKGLLIFIGVALVYLLGMVIFYFRR